MNKKNYLRPKGDHSMKNTKRIGYLMEKLCTRENALLAIEAVNEPRKKNKTAQWVESTKEARADELCELLRDFHPKKPRTFPRYDSTAGKWREINEPALWPDQYVHHMIVQVLAPVLMRGMDFYCCGSIPGRGPHRARKAIEKWLEKDQKGTKYAAELDIKKFYPSLSPREVMRFLRRKIKDEAFLGLIWRIIKDGIKIGFYISQWLANAVLEPLDHYIREKLGDGVRHYVRYIDNDYFRTQQKETPSGDPVDHGVFGENGPPPKGELATLQHPQTHGERGRLPLQAGPNSDPQEKPPPPEKTMHPGPETDRGPPQNSADPGTGNFITVGTAKALCRVEPLR